MFKRILSIVLIIFVLTSIVGCSEKPKEASNGVKITQYKNLSVKKANYIVSEAYLDFVLQETVKTYASMEKVEKGTVKKGDMICLSYVTYYGDQKLEEATITNYTFTIGEKKFTEDFETAIEGKPINEEFSVEISYPYNSTHTILDGKKVTHKVTIHYLCNIIYPELNDEFIRTHVKESASTKEAACKTVLEYKEFLKGRYEFVYAEKSKKLLVADILEQLLAYCEFPELPEEDIQAYVDSKYKYYLDYCKEAGVTIQTYYMMTGITEEEFLAQLRKDGEDVVKKSLIVDAIKEFENIKLTDEYYEKYLKYLATYYQFDSIDELKESIAAMGVEETIRTDAEMEMVYEFLIKYQNIQIEDIDLYDLAKKEGVS